MNHKLRKVGALVVGGALAAAGLSMITTPSAFAAGTVSIGIPPAAVGAADVAIVYTDQIQMLDTSTGITGAVSLGWQSSNTKVATVNAAGLVTAKSVTGETVISLCYSVPGSTTNTCAQKTVAVIDPTTVTVALSPLTPTVKVAGTVKETATVSAPGLPAGTELFYHDAPAAVAWTSDTEVSLDPTGTDVSNALSSTVTGLTSVGAANVCVNLTQFTNTYGAAAWACTAVKVVPSGLTVSPSTATLTLPDMMDNATLTVKLKAVFDAPSANQSTPVTWSSSDTSVATVGGAGLVTAVGPGKATITACSTLDTSVCGAAVITVIQPVTGIIPGANQDMSLSIGGGIPYQLVAAILPADATNKGIVWSSDNPNIASVDANGVVTGHIAGVAYITATPDDATWQANCATYEYCGVTFKVTVLSAAPVQQAQPVCNVFTDIAGNRFQADICWAAETGVTIGATPTTFDPNRITSRAEMAKFLYRLAGSPVFTPDAKSPFSDVAADNSETYKAIDWLYLNGITFGAGGTSADQDLIFAPGNLMTRGQMAAMFARYAKATLGTPQPGGVSVFADMQVTDQFYAEAAWALSNGVTIGNTQNPLTYAPGMLLARAPMAAMLHRFSTNKLGCAAYPGTIGCNI